jgi:isopenicillin-N epimerase
MPIAAAAPRAAGYAHVMDPHHAAEHIASRAAADVAASAWSPLANAWSRLDKRRVFLNHGSFGACPDAVLDRQAALRDELEADPVAFMVERLAPLWNDATTRLAGFVHADPEGLAFVTNATTAVNTVLRSLRFQPGDELLTNGHEYNACVNAARFALGRVGASVVIADIGERGGHVADDDQVVEHMLAAVTPRTKLAMLSHVTSPTGLVLPIERLVRQFEDRGVPVLVDGAHALGMLPLDLKAINASYYTANCHKWLCAPKGAAFLYVREDNRGDWNAIDDATATIGPGSSDRDNAAMIDPIRPLTISHGMNSPNRNESRFRVEFDWQGTFDPTPMLCVPAAIDTLADMIDGGWPGIMQRNRDLALAARDLIADRLGLEPMGPASMIGSLAALRLPDRPDTDLGDSPVGMGLTYPEALQRELVAGRWSAATPIQVPIIPWTRQNGEPGGRLLRVSAHLYNDLGGYQALVDALDELLARS